MMNKTVTRENVAQRLKDHLQHRLSLEELVDWAETVMMDGELEPGHNDEIRDVVARIGVADVRAFGLTWQDCEELLARLGYTARIDVAAG
jgi:cobyrinic acid a,c-diamide synthase